MNATERQKAFIKGICETLDIDYKEPKTKAEASAWLKQYIPKYHKVCEQNELEREANPSELMNNYGDWGE